MGDSPVRAGNDRQPTPAPPERMEAAAERLAQVERLDEFRDAGLLTESELEEQKAKLRWGSP